MSEQLSKIEKEDALQSALLKGEIADLTNRLNEIQQKTRNFEAIIRNALSEEILEIQELSVIYKQLQKTKKEKRLIQKQKGKNFKERIPADFPAVRTKAIKENLSDQKELRRIYKETMWLVHPDKFAMQEELEEQATVLTQQLIDIYQSGDLEHMKAFYAQLCQGSLASPSTKILKPDSMELLKIELLNLKKKLEEAEAEHLYKVMLEYENPMDYVSLLKTYFDDKLFKLRKRTRKFE